MCPRSKPELEYMLSLTPPMQHVKKLDEYLAEARWVS
jgi:hypothetical protein